MKYAPPLFNHLYCSTTYSHKRTEGIDLQQLHFRSSFVYEHIIKLSVYIIYYIPIYCYIIYNKRSNCATVVDFFYNFFIFIFNRVLIYHIFPLFYRHE